jgi:hypothetical protein
MMVQLENLAAAPVRNVGYRIVQVVQVENIVTILARIVGKWIVVDAIAITLKKPVILAGVCITRG